MHSMAFSSFSLARKLHKRNKKNFYNPQRAYKGHLCLPRNTYNHGNINMVVVACILALFVLLTGYSQAIGGIIMVSIVKDYVNMRTGPGTRYKILWVLGKGCPLKVVGSKGNWYRVKDFGGDTGWIYKPLTSRTPHVVVKKEIVNIRSLPGSRNSLWPRLTKALCLKPLPL